ncbi:MAG TPA: hypothetical protein VMS09_17915 [Paenibacillus sp.]|uniref:hypothetical protein n=1 Tax=Paenibacillus sp. TaxID=58172 RepID=UPI0028D74BFE|nr:hypothetical protein [Paenibacillus sp.]HUC93862.1 hypothetical protein [Paenibacillus sp.]
MGVPPFHTPFYTHIQHGLKPSGQENAFAKPGQAAQHEPFAPNLPTGMAMTGVSIGLVSRKKPKATPQSRKQAV